MFGLESAVNASKYQVGHEEHEKQLVWNTLQGVPTTGSDPVREFNRIMQCILMRARVNNHRHYEVYVVDMPSYISEGDVTLMFKENPQGMADLIREKGTKYFSNRASTGKVVIQ